MNADLFAFLTTEANGVVGPIHPKAMPVILTSEDEIETWMSAPRRRSCVSSVCCRMTPFRSSPEASGRTTSPHRSRLNRLSYVAVLPVSRRATLALIRADLL